MGSKLRISFCIKRSSPVDDNLTFSVKLDSFKQGTVSRYLFLSIFLFLTVPLSSSCTSSYDFPRIQLISSFIISNCSSQKADGNFKYIFWGVIKIGEERRR